MMSSGLKRVLSAALVLAGLMVAGCELLGLRWDVEWEREFEASGYDYIGARDMASSPDGGVMVVGTTTAWDALEYDALVIRLDRDGRELARRLYGGLYIDELVDVRTVPSGGYIASGTYSGRGWLARLNEDGDTAWTRSFGDSASFTHLDAVTPTTDGGYAAVGSIGVQGQGERTLFVRTDANGTELWRKEGTLPQDAARPVCVIEQSDGGFLISGVGLIRTNSNGDTLWTRGYPFGWGFDLCPAPEGGFYGAGDSIDRFPGPQNIVTARFNADGETLWKRTFHDETVQHRWHIAAAPDGGCVVLGTLGTIYEGGDRSRALVLKYSPDGGLEWKHVLGSDRSSCRAGVADSDGWFTVAVQEDPQDGPNRLTLMRTKP
jgi:outer membrane protein assembly factor BamB